MSKPYYMTPAGDVEIDSETNDEGDIERLSVRGMAVDYNRVAYFGRNARVAIAPGAAAKRLEKRLNSKQRDVLALIAHDPSRPIGRTANGSLKFEDTPEGLTYSLDLDPADPEAMSAYAKVKSGVLNAASIGFFVKEAADTKMADNSPDAKEAGAEVEVELASDIDVFEVSLVAHGAMGGASALAASAHMEGAVQDDDAADTVEPDESPDDPLHSETPPESEPASDPVPWSSAAAEWQRLGIINRQQVTTILGG